MKSQLKSPLKEPSRNQLTDLFQAIDQAVREEDLRSHVAPKIGEYFQATRSGVFFFDRILSEESDLSPAFKKAVEVALSTELNPVARYIVERHTPAHEGLVASPKAWQLICPRPDHWHVMAGPIVSKGGLVGTLGCTREKSRPAFDAQDLADMSAVSLHLSVWATTVRTRHHGAIAPPLSARLTARERQIADLVALGKKNAEVGAELWITENSVKQALKKIFRKLEVSSRTEMAAQLSTEKQMK